MGLNNYKTYKWTRLCFTALKRLTFFTETYWVKWTFFCVFCSLKIKLWVNLFPVVTTVKILEVWWTLLNFYMSYHKVRWCIQHFLKLFSLSVSPIVGKILLMKYIDHNPDLYSFTIKIKYQIPHNTIPLFNKGGISVK